METNTEHYGIEPNRFYTKQEVADRFQASINTVSKWLTLGKLKRTKVGGGTRITGENLIKFVQQSNQRTG